MEFIKKTIQQKVTTGTTTGCTNCAVIIPDTGVTYNMLISLTSDSHDLGFFNAYDFSNVYDVITPTVTYTVTGTSSSMLNEIRKSGYSPYVYNQYFLSTNPNINGLDLEKSGLSGTQNVTDFTNFNVVYYVGGITYTQLSGASGSTLFSMLGQQFSPLNFTNESIIKDENKENMTGKPIISSDVFIIRQEFSVFERNYNLEFIKNIAQLETYAGGAYFNIISNT
jgi:hypothetical protein